MAPGETLFHARYRVIYTIDERPGIRTYRCRDEQTGVLALVAEFAAGDTARRDLESLAKQIATVRHDALLPLQDHFAEGDRYYFVCADPGGQDLERMTRARGGPFPEADALLQATRLLHLLEHLHSQRPPLFLGDLAPGDVWISEQGVISLAPFTLASPIGQAPSPYRAPELVRADAEPTTVSDVYTVGALAYHMLTGWSPPTPEQQEAGMPLNGPRVLNPQISPLVEQVLLRALQLRAVNRFQVAREMRIALETAHMMGGRSLGLGPDVLMTAAQVPANAALAQLPASPPPAPGPAPVVSPPAMEAPPAGQVYPPGAYPPGYAPAPPQRRGLSTGCMIVAAVVLTVAAIAVCLVIAFFLPGSPLRQILNTANVSGQATSTPATAVPQATAPPATGDATATPAAPPATPPSTEILPELGPDAITLQTVAAITATRELTAAVLGPVAYSPDGQVLAVGISQSVSLHDATTLDDRGTLLDHTGKVTSLAWSSDSTLLASGASDDTDIRVWNVADGRLARRLSGHSGWIRSLAFSPSGTTLASGSTDQTVRLWDASTGQLLATLTGHTGFIGGVVFSPDGATLASAARDGSVRLWDVATGQEKSGFSFRTALDPDTNLRYWATGVAFSPDGTILAVGATDGVVYLVDATSGQQIRQLRGHTNWIVIRGLAFSPDGATLYSSGLDATVRAWNVASGAELATFDTHRLDIFSIAISPDGERLVSVSDQEGRLIVWDLLQRRPDTSLRIGLGLVTSLLFSPDSAVLGSVGYNGVIQLRLLADDRGRQFTGSVASVQSLAFLPNGRLAAITDQNAVTVLDIGQEQTQDLPGLTATPLCVASDTGGSVVAAGSDDGTLTIWDGQRGDLRQSLKTDLPAVFLVAVSGDGALAAVAGPPSDPRIEIWRTTDGVRLHTLSGPRNAITGVAFQPGGALIAATSTDGVLRVWDRWSGALVRSIQARPEQGWFSAMAFSPDGELLATGTPTGVLQFWNASSGAEAARVDQEYGVLALAFSPDGEQFAVAGRDAGTTLYGLPAVR